MSGHHWERYAGEWIAWTRTPGHDVFWSYRETFRDGGHFTGTDSRDGLTMHYEGWSRSAAEYLTAVADAGFAIIRVHEPRPDADAPARLARW